MEPQVRDTLVHPFLQALPEDQRQKLVAHPRPGWMGPMLAMVADRTIPAGDWIFERKFDGERCLVFSDGKQVRMLSRNQTLLNHTYPELEEALKEAAEGEFIADGEIVALDGETSSFSLLQARMQIHDREKAGLSRVPVFLYLFDLMYLDGFDLSALGLRFRKALLKNLFTFQDPVRYTTHREGDGRGCFREACARGWEGIIAKRGSGRYLHRRSPDWLKFKCLNRQEFVIAGYTDPGRSRAGFGALLLGYYEGDRLVYAGRVGTGFDTQTLTDLGAALASLEQESSPFAGRTRQRGEHFVTPALVCEVIFTEWTPDGRLRHPRFVGLRDDKPARGVVRERPERE